MIVGVIDYGVGNLGSVLRALEKLHVKPVRINHPDDMGSADCLILPGVGNFKDCKALLHQHGWDEALNLQVRVKGRPLLGICVGMQLLADSSTEGVDAGGITGGLGLIPGRVEHLADLGCRLRLPHVGWNNVKTCGVDGVLFRGVPDETDFYFVHSYVFVPKDPGDVLATADYGVTVTAAVRSGNVWGTQFHPEKSANAGLRVLENFIEQRR